MCYAQLLHRKKGGIIRNAQKIIELNPNSGFLVGTAGWFLTMTGEFDEGFDFIERSMQLNPRFPS